MRKRTWDDTLFVVLVMVFVVVMLALVLGIVVEGVLGR
jgi:hypothetical protein